MEWLTTFERLNVSAVDCTHIELPRLSRQFLNDVALTSVGFPVMVALERYAAVSKMRIHRCGFMQTAAQGYLRRRQCFAWFLRSSNSCSRLHTNVHSGYPCADDEHGTRLLQAADMGAGRNSNGIVPRSLGNVISMLRTSLLPHGYPGTVAPEYAVYARWSAAAAAFSSMSGVLSTHALLTAVGVGAAGAAPLAAALNWVIKDGLGQLGGVVSTALISTRFDAEPKRWRLLSAVALDAATLLELCTPFAPAFFLPLAAAANVGKNMAWLSASASRAGLHQALAMSGNLADVTRAAGSQTIAACSFGTLLGAAIAPLFGSALAGSTLAAFAILSAAHISCVYVAVRAVALPTVNAERLRFALAPAIANLLPHSERSEGGKPSDAGHNSKMNSASLTVLSPQMVAPLDTVLNLHRVSVSAQSARAIRVVAETPLAVLAERGLLNGAVSTTLRSSYYALIVDDTHQRDIDAGGRASLPAAANGAGIEIHVLIAKDAGWGDVIRGHIHALILEATLATAAAEIATQSVGRGGVDARTAMIAVAVSTAAVAFEKHGSALLALLEGAGWWVGVPLLVANDWRVELRGPQVVTGTA